MKKWYLDCVDTAGEAWIGYCVEVRWLGLRLAYSASLRPGRAAIEASRIGRASFPEVQDGGVRWAAPEVGVRSCELRFATVPVRRELWHGPRGSVTWSCVAPTAAVTAEVDGTVLSGIGYAEVLEMGVPPWTLGIDEIRWGRLADESSPLVWIDCPGTQPVRVAYHNGDEVDIVRADDQEIELSDGTVLRIPERTIIRDEQLSGSIRHFGLLARLVPRRLREARERKWLSRGTLIERGGSRHEGWVIHERVDLRTD